MQHWKHFVYLNYYHWTSPTTIEILDYADQRPHNEQLEVFIKLIYNVLCVLLSPTIIFLLTYLKKWPPSFSEYSKTLQKVGVGLMILAFAITWPSLCNPLHGCSILIQDFFCWDLATPLLHVVYSARLKGSHFMEIGFFGRKIEFWRKKTRFWKGTGTFGGRGVAFQEGWITHSSSHFIITQSWGCLLAKCLKKLFGLNRTLGTHQLS